MKLLEKLRCIVLKIFDWFLEEPKRLVRLVVLSICSIVVFFQLWECVMKLLHPPISTHSHFDLNQTMHYPAVTICREPGYKREAMHVRMSLPSLVHESLANRNTICLSTRRSPRTGNTFPSTPRRCPHCLTRRLLRRRKCSWIMHWTANATTLKSYRLCTSRWDAVTRSFRELPQLCRWIKIKLDQEIS